MKVTKVMTDDQKFVAVEVTDSAHSYSRSVGFASCNFNEGDKFNYKVGYDLALLRAMEKTAQKIRKRLPEDVKEVAPFGEPVEPPVSKDFKELEKLGGTIVHDTYVIIQLNDYLIMVGETEISGKYDVTISSRIDGSVLDMYRIPKASLNEVIELHRELQNYS